MTIRGLVIVTVLGLIVVRPDGRVSGVTGNNRHSTVRIQTNELLKFSPRLPLLGVEWFLSVKTNPKGSS